MGLLRTSLERLSRGKALWRRLPQPFSSAHILVTPDAALSYLKLGANWCDPELLHIASRFVSPGNVVWDVGANVGVFGVASALRSGPKGQVLCVEPDLLLAQLIRKTAARLPDNCARLETLAVAIAGSPGIAQFHIAERGRASNKLAQFGDRTQTGGVRERQLVPVFSLDDLLTVSPPPAVLKINVEGAEAVVFDGATRVLAEARPLIYVEVSPDNAQKVTRQLRSTLTIYSIRQRGWTIAPPWKPASGTPLRSPRAHRRRIRNSASINANVCSCSAGWDAGSPRFRNPKRC